MAIRFLLVENCCFYIPLVNGVKFFGFLSLSGCILLLLFAVLDLAYMAHLVSGQQIALVAVDMIVQIIQSSTATLLLLGTYQRKPKLITYWLITTPIVAILEFTVLSNVTYLFFAIRRYELDWFILNSIAMVDDIYGWMLAYSFYHSILPPNAAPV